MLRYREIYCCECQHETVCQLVDGKEIYPHRTELQALPFWRCPACFNYVGCHNKTRYSTRPLGNIPTEEMRAVRSAIHREMDPLWKSGVLSRKKLYAYLSTVIGRTYHTAELRTLEEAQKVYVAVESLNRPVVPND